MSQSEVRSQKCTRVALGHSKSLRTVLAAIALLGLVAGQLWAQTPSRPPSPAGPTVTSGPLDELKKAYAGVNALEALFHQKLFIAGLNKVRDFEGDFVYKRGKGFLWKYRTPKIKYFLYDGRNIYQGEEDKAFITKERINKEKTGGTFLDLVEDMAKLDDLFTLKQQTRSGDLEVLDLTPKKESSVTMARVWVDKENRVKKIEIHEFTGNVNTMEFTAIKVNQAVDESKLVFRPEKGKEILER